jgi:hypothetical protein
VEVLIRVTEGDYKTDRGFNASLIKFNNTQNIIKSSDFRSNDTIQRWLETGFADLRPRGAVTKKFQYVRKRSGKRIANADPLRLEELAKIRFTWVKEPTQATADPKSLWAYGAEGGHYETAFGIAGELEDTWPGSVFEEALLAVISYRALEDKISAIVKKDRSVLWLRRLRFFALALFRDYIQMKGVAVGTLLGSASTFKSTIDEFWPNAWVNLVHAHNQAVRQENTTVFALARSDTRWRQIQSSFRTIMAGLEA